MSFFEIIHTPSLPATDFQIEFGESFGRIERKLTPKNIMREREIYISKSGNVSFLIQGTVYPLMPGDAIMIAPHEYFHCIHHDDEPFRYYRILAGEAMIDTVAQPLRFASRARKARFCFPGAVRNELYEVCENLLKAPNASSLYHILHLFHILCSFRAHYTEEDAVIEKYETCLPIELRKLIHYIRNHTRQAFSIAQLAEEHRLSAPAVSHLFKEYLSLSPKEYIEGIRMAEATHLLPCDLSLTEAANLLTYKDLSHFSAVFKKHYHTTPLKYVRSGGTVYHLDL